MSDWTGTAFQGVVVTNAGIAAGGAAGDIAAAFPSVSTGTWPAANRAIYVPIVVQAPTTFYQLALTVQTQSGNLDVGIYSETGNRLVSSGSTAVAAAGIQVVNLTDTPVNPGCYFLAMCCDNTTASFQRYSISALQFQTMGIQQQAVGAVTLPDPATFANPASSYVPTLFVSTMQATI